MMIFLLKFVFVLNWAKCVDKLSLLTVLLVDSQPRRAHYFAKQSIVGYTLLISLLFCFAFASKVFLTIMYWKAFLKNHFQLVSNFIYLPPSFYFFAIFVLMSPQKDKSSPYLYWKVSISLRGCFAKNFYPFTIIGKLRTVCRGISQKFYKKIAENFFSTIAYKKEVRYYSNFLFRLYF